MGDYFFGVVNGELVDSSHISLGVLDFTEMTLGCQVGFYDQPDSLRI